MTVLTSQKVASWLEFNRGITGVKWIFDADNFERAINADQSAMISFTGGPGLQVEDAIDAVTFQIRCRGPQQDDAGGALELARQIDAVIVTATYHGPTVIVDVPVSHAGRVGSAPALFGPRDVARRVQTACNYLFEVASSLG